MRVMPSGCEMRGPRWCHWRATGPNKCPRESLKLHSDARVNRIVHQFGTRGDDGKTTTAPHLLKHTTAPLPRVLSLFRGLEKKCLEEACVVLI